MIPKSSALMKLAQHVNDFTENKISNIQCKFHTDVFEVASKWVYWAPPPKKKTTLKSPSFPSLLDLPDSLYKRNNNDILVNRRKLL